MKKGKVISIGLVCSMVLGLIEPTGFIRSQATVETNQKIDSILQEKMSNSEDVLPVHVWFNDYDPDDLESKIEAEIGYSIDDLEENYEAPSTELLVALEKAACQDDENKACNFGEAENLLSTYVDSTADARNREEEKTEKYLSTRKKICSEIHHAEAERIANSYGINSNNISYICDYAPFMICQMTSKDIERVAQCDEVQELYLYEDPGPICEEEERPSRSMSSALTDAYANNNAAVGVNRALGKFSLNTTNAKIGFYANGHVANNSTDLQNLGAELPSLINPNTVHVVCTHSPSCYTPNGHHTWCATIAGGYYGVAPNASIYTACFNSDNPSGTYNDYLSLMNQSDVVCWEAVWTNSSTPTYKKWEQIVDAVTKSTCTLNIVPAGNGTTYICTPGNAYNAVTVGGYIVGNPDTMYSGSNYSHGNHCLKPDVIAPAQLNIGIGTSYSAAMVAGMAALLIRFKPSLKAKPEVCKAILMASCHKKINESLSSGWTTHEGAGIPNLYTMFNIVAQQTYGYGCLKSTNNYEQTRYFNQQKYKANNTNMCVAFLHSGVNNTSGDDLDVDITLEKRDGTAVGTSNASKSSTELLYKPTTTADYKLRVYKFGSVNQETTKYGYAWSTDKTYNYYVGNRNTVDIVCYLHNSGSNYYLTQNLSTNALTQQS